MLEVESTSRSNPLLDRQNISTPFSQLDASILQISGNSSTLIQKRRLRLNRGDYKYLKVNVSGTGMKSFGYCCFYFTIIMTAIFFFPLFCFCCDWFKRRVYNIFNININVYEVISQLIQDLDPLQCYIVVQDNNFDQDKAQVLLEALQKSHLQKFQMVNIATGINIKENNYSNFSDYMKKIRDYVQQSNCRWGNKSL